MDERRRGPRAGVLKKARAAMAAGGAAELFRWARAGARRFVPRAHCFVFGYLDHRALPAVAPGIALEFQEIGISDGDAIGGVVAVDEWNMRRSEAESKLAEGWLCFVVKHEGRIVGGHWIFAGKSFEDPQMRRTFRLADNEAYYWRGSCLKPYRGKGVVPYLAFRTALEIGAGRGRTRGYAITRAGNAPMLRAYLRMGWVRLGRVGYLGMPGLRFHYLTGPEAFVETRNRVFFGRV